MVYVTFYFFFTCIIDWVCSIRTARSGGIYGACLSYLIALKLICIKSLTREQIYTYYIVLLGCIFCFVQLVRSNLYNISLVAHGWSFFKYIQTFCKRVYFLKKMKAPLTLIYFVVRIILIYRISFEYIFLFP